MTRRVAIVQSCYIPWRGYFAIIARCDAFVILDSVQFTRRDWRTRNRIKTPQGPLWLSVPVRQKGHYHAPIDAIEISDPSWVRLHLRSIEANYRRATQFAAVFPILQAAYDRAAAETRLSPANRMLIGELCRLRLDRVVVTLNPKQRPNSGEKLIVVERLRDEVVRSGLDRLRLLLPAAGRDHDHR